MTNVKYIWRITMKPYSLVSRETKKDNTIIEIKTGNAQLKIGEGYLTIIAGPCAVESEDSYLDIARTMKELGVHILRGGIFKPRTSPYSFSGLGEKGLDILALVKSKTGLAVAAEVLDVRDINRMIGVVDIVQIGSRNMQNFALLQEVGRLDMPIILKRGFAATVEEWLLAAEYIMAAGNNKIILCERGIRTFENLTRNSLDIGTIPLVKELTHLPVIVDPSHATGRWQLVRPVAKAAVAAGADGLMVEVHQNPKEALSDGKQSLTPENFTRLMGEVKSIAFLEKKSIN
ncbi:MAG: 3-deoxy-7-phosphoheptulonate synthase [Chitinophagales bacterium]